MICATGSQAFCPEIDKKPVSWSLIFPWIWVLYIFPSSIQLPPMAIDATDWDEGYVGIDGSRIRVVSKNCGKGVTGRGQIQQGFRRHFGKQDEDSLRILEGKLQQYRIASYDCCIIFAPKIQKNTKFVEIPLIPTPLRPLFIHGCPTTSVSWRSGYVLFRYQVDSEARSPCSSIWWMIKRQTKQSHK